MEMLKVQNRRLIQLKSVERKIFAIPCTNWTLKTSYVDFVNLGATLLPGAKMGAMKGAKLYIHKLLGKSNCQLILNKRPTQKIEPLYRKLHYK